MAACLLALTIQLLEEALEIGHENVLAPQYFPLGEQLRRARLVEVQREDTQTVVGAYRADGTEGGWK